jgi:hypothetical protein
LTPGYSRDTLVALRHQFIVANVTNFLGENIRKSGTFTIPILGVSFDRDIFWLFNGFLGILGYFITSSLLKNDAENLLYLISVSRNDEFRIHMVLSTQILGDTAYYDRRQVVHGWVRPIMFVYMLPILISTYVLLNELYVTDIAAKTWSDFIGGDGNLIGTIIDTYASPNGILNDFRYSPIRQSFIIFGSLAMIYIQFILLRTLYANMRRITLSNYRARQELGRVLAAGPHDDTDRI